MEKDKPTVKLIGEDGNVFNLIGLVAKALRAAGQNEEAKQVTEEAFGAKSYEEITEEIIPKYVIVT